MRKNNLNFELKSRVRRYLEYKKENENNLDVKACNEIFNKLNKSLRDEVHLESVGKYIENIPFFNRNFSKTTNKKLAFSLKELSFSPEEIIYKVLFSFIDKNLL